MLIFAFGSLAIGSMIALLVGKLIIKPIQNISNAFDELSKGNFSIKISEDQKLQEIRDMAKHFNEMTFDLSHIETLRSDFVVNVSHEFKTPIAAIEGYATLLENPSLTKENHDRYVEKILDNSRRLSNLSSDILTLSKLENQETIPNQKFYRLDEQLRRLILSLENKWTEKNIGFNIDLPNVKFYGNEQMLDRVWLNILDNAIKHSPDGATVTVEISESEYEVSVSISDCGEGMSEDVQKHIFEKFYQADSSRKSEGNGLGLALAKRITDLCKGEISVESSIGSGSKFIVSLPITQKFS
ncbi:MAG: sensor histidine kinase [Oscillospiraceae bacterium]